MGVLKRVNRNSNNQLNKRNIFYFR